MTQCDPSRSRQRTRQNAEDSDQQPHRRVLKAMPHSGERDGNIGAAVFQIAGSVSAVMNTLGNIGGALSATMVTYAVKGYGWNAPFFVTGALCLIAAALYLKIDASKRIFA